MTIFKRISAVLFGVFMVTAVSPDARAVPVNVTFSSGISSSSGALSGLTQWTLSFTVDNNGTSLLSQTWTSSDITTVVDGFGVGNGYTATYIGVDNFELETDATGAFLNSAIFDDTSTGVGGNFDSIPSGAAVMTTAGPTAGGINFALMSISTQTESGWSIELTDQGGGDVPEPGTLALFGVGLLGVGFIARRRRKV